MDEIQILRLFKRSQSLLTTDLNNNFSLLDKSIEKKKFLIIGAAGTIGSAVSLEIFKRKPQGLYLVDISENNLVEVVRQMRSTTGDSETELKTFAIDFGSPEFSRMLEASGPFDYVLNLAALKHVRSEKDPYTLTRMLRVNVLNSIRLQRFCDKFENCKYFCVSTDKAANPANIMGASKLMMERLLLSNECTTTTSFARFANVAFSDGSLLHGFINRIRAKQPLTAPSDIKRYFVSKQESGQICLLSAVLGGDSEIFFPKLDATKDLLSFKDLTYRFLNALDLSVHECESEYEARNFFKTNNNKNKTWPCYFFESDTTGEKPFEEFHTKQEILDLSRFASLGIIKKNRVKIDVNNILDQLEHLSEYSQPKKSDILKIVNKIVPEFEHQELGRYLDEKM
jgi:nucleoside-diphosphate-sugar epimerase